MCRWVILCHELLPTRGIGSSVRSMEMAAQPAFPCHQLPGSVPAKRGGQQHPQPFPTTLGQGQGARLAELCSQQQTLPCLCCLAHRSLGDEKILLRSRHVGARCRMRGWRVPGREVGVGVCAWASSLKNLLLVCNSSHITSAEIRVHQRQPRDDKSPEGLQRGFWASTSGIPRSISLQVKWKTMTISFVCKIIKLVFPSLQNTWVSLEKAEGLRMGNETGKGKNGWLTVLGSVQLEMGFQH